MKVINNKFMMIVYSCLLIIEGSFFVDELNEKIVEIENQIDLREFSTNLQ